MSDEMTERPDVLAEWCGACNRYHQPREHPIECQHVGCRRLTGHYHGTCEEHT